MPVANPTGVNGPRAKKTTGRLRHAATNIASKQDTYPSKVTARGGDLPSPARVKLPTSGGLSRPKAGKATAQASVEKVAELRKVQTPATAQTDAAGVTGGVGVTAPLRASQAIMNLAMQSSGQVAGLGQPQDVPRDVRNVVSLGQRLARQRFGWTGEQWNALYELWRRESGWRPSAVNSSSGAAGIPQMLPSAHPSIDVQAFLSDPRWQIMWGLRYIAQRYGDPVAALQHSNRYHWY